MTRCGERNKRFIDDLIFGDGPPARILWVLHLAAVRLWGFTRRPRTARETPVRTEPLPTSLERRSKLKAILLVVVVVLVLDLLWGNRSARVTPAARFGRSLALPP